MIIFNDFFTPTVAKFLFFPVQKNTQNLRIKHHGKEMGMLLIAQASNDQVFSFFHSFE